jgi:hypothetical protein
MLTLSLGLAAIVLFVALRKEVTPIVMVKLGAGVPLLLYGTFKVIMKCLCPWCPKIQIQSPRGVSPYDTTPY